LEEFVPRQAESSFVVTEEIEVLGVAGGEGVAALGRDAGDVLQLRVEVSAIGVAVIGLLFERSSWQFKIAPANSPRR
jgi:hypothetical protein